MSTGACPFHRKVVFYIDFLFNILGRPRNAALKTGGYRCNADIAEYILCRINICLHGIEKRRVTHVISPLHLY